MKKMLPLLLSLGTAGLLAGCQTPLTAVEEEDGTPVSPIKYVGYDQDQGSLVVTFESGDVFLFMDVPGETYRDLMETDSKGQYFNDKVNGQYPYKQVR